MIDPTFSLNEVYVLFILSFVLGMLMALPTVKDEDDDDGR